MAKRRPSEIPSAVFDQPTVNIDPWLEALDTPSEEPLAVDALGDRLLRPGAEHFHPKPLGARMLWVEVFGHLLERWFGTF